jgi:hypothetical protein
MKIEDHYKRFGISTLISIIIPCLFILVFIQINSTYFNIWNNTKKINVTCEQTNQTKFLAQPHNALTTLAFFPSFLIPLCFFVADFKSHTNPTRLSKHPYLSFLSFFGYLVHWIGTFVNHACGCSFGLVLDNLFLWSSLSLPIIITFTVYIPKISKAPKYYIVVSCLYFINSFVSVILALQELPLIAQTIITVCFLAIIIISNLIFVIRSYKIGSLGHYNGFFWGSIVSGILGLIFAGLDQILCGSHSLWHIFGGISLTLLYMHHWCIHS